MITGYRSNRNREGDKTVYNQHKKRYFAARQIEECPWKLWLDDVVELIKQKTKLGHQIVLIVDINKYAKGMNIKKWARCLVLREVVSLKSP